MAFIAKPGVNRFHTSVTICLCLLWVADGSAAESTSGERLRSVIREAQEKQAKLASVVGEVPANELKSAILGVLAERNARLQTELEAAVLVDVKTGSYADLTTIAECCEMFELPDDCMRIAFAGIKREPKKDGAYLPLIRTLVHLQQLNEAEKILVEAEAQVGANSPVRALHSLVYFQWAVLKKWDRAIPHIEQHVQFLVQAAKERPKDAEMATFWIDQLAFAYRQGLAEEEGKKRLEKAWETISALKLETSEDAKPTGKSRWADRMRHHCAVLELRCALESHTHRDRLPDSVDMWMSTLSEFADDLLLDDFATELSTLCRFLRTRFDTLKPHQAILVDGLKELEEVVAKKGTNPNAKPLVTLLQGLRLDFKRTVAP